MVVTKNPVHEIKNKAGQVVTYNSTNFHSLNKKLDLLEKSDRKVKKNSKNQSQNSACEEKKLLARKQIFVQTPFSRSTLKLERKNCSPQNHSFHFLLRRDKDHHSNLTSKIMKMCEQN